jgi:hypothetical protein
MIKQHDHRSAAVLLEYIETLHEKLGAHRERIKARSARGLLFCKMGDFESARTILEDSRDLAELLSFDDLCQQIEQELAKPPLSRRR